MKAGAVFPLLFLLCATSTATFYGDSINFKAPMRNGNGSLTMSIYHRVNGKENCGDESSFTCEDNKCLNLMKSTVHTTSQDTMEPSKWCQAESYTTVNVSEDQMSITLKNSSCCWATNVENRENFVSFAEMNLGIRSDIHTQNSCPVTATVPRFWLPQNCVGKFNLLAYDPDQDHVRCSFPPGSEPPANFSLDADACTLNNTAPLDLGVHVFAVILEDFPTHNISVMYKNGKKELFNKTSPPLCKVTMHFSLEVLPPVPMCEVGKGKPMFLPMTPFHGDVIYATVGQVFKLHADAQVQEASIENFQVSGPISMTKEFIARDHGKANMTLSWTPQGEDMNRFVPVCFTAVTNQTQSEMRCVVIVVTESTLVKGKATVDCSLNKMTVAIERASMPDLDPNYLTLLDDTCSLSSNASHVIASMSANTCGTKILEQGNYIFIKNQIHSFEAPTELIIRRRMVKIDFYCQFHKTATFNNYYSVRQSDYIFTESNFGSFSYTFDIFTDDTFTKKVEPSAYPVQAKLLQPFYLGIQAQSELPHVKLFVESCRGIPDENPNNTIAYELIKHGCSLDSSLKIHKNNGTIFNFEVQAFKFTGDYNQVYISCSVLMCDMNSPFSRCAQGCLQSSPSSRRKRESGMETFKHSIIQGPMQFAKRYIPVEKGINSVVVKQSDVLAEASTESSEGGWGILQKLSTNISNVVFANLFLVSLVLLVGVFLYFTRKRRAEDQKCLVDSDSN